MLVMASGIIKCIQLLVRLEFRVTSFLLEKFLLTNMRCFLCGCVSGRESVILLSVLGSVYMWFLFLAVSYVGKF